MTPGGDPNGYLDYARPGAWERVVALLTRAFVPVPAALRVRVECEPGWSWRRVLVDYDCWFVVRGRGEARINGQAHALAPGTLLFLRPGDAIAASQSPADRLTVVSVHFTFAPRAGDEAPPAPFNPAWLPARVVRVADVARLDALLSRVVALGDEDDPFAAAEASLVLAQALVEIYRQDATARGATPDRPQRDGRVARVAAHLRGHPAARLSLEEAAAMVALSPEYFSRLFERETGCSFRAFAVRVRLERARHLLQETDMTVSEIAAALGYREPFLLSRQFARHYGYPPRAARG